MGSTIHSDFRALSPRRWPSTPVTRHMRSNIRKGCNAELILGYMHHSSPMPAAIYDDSSFLGDLLGAMILLCVNLHVSPHFKSGRRQLQSKKRILSRSTFSPATEVLTLLTTYTTSRTAWAELQRHFDDSKPTQHPHPKYHLRTTLRTI